jgi:outer membrane protein assembly factor BamB
MVRAIDRHRAGEARVVPVLLRPADWTNAPFSVLQVLPLNAQPVTLWPDHDAAFEDVAQGVRRVVSEVLSQPFNAPDSPLSATLSQQAPLSHSPAASQLLRSSHRRISRRVAVIGLAGLTGIGVLGGLVWQAHSQESHMPSAAATSTAAVRSTIVASAQMYANAVATDGVMSGFNAQHTRTNPYERVITPATVSGLKKKWVYQARHTPSSPVVAEGTVYVGSFDSSVYAIEAASGHLKWAYQTGNIVHSVPAVKDDTVYIGSADGKLYALETTSGHPKWTYQTGSYIYGSSPTVADGTVYIGSHDHSLYAIDMASGRLKWIYQTSHDITSSPAVAEGIVYVSSEDQNVYAIDAISGRRKWVYQTGGPIFFSSPTVVNGVLYIGSQDQSLHALDAASGGEKWAYQVGNPIDSSPAVADGVVYIGSGQGQSLHAVNAASGSLKWVYQTRGVVEASPTVAGDVVYIGSRDYSLYALEAASGVEKWTYQTGNGVDTSPAVVDGVLYMSSADHNLYAFDLPG